MRKKGTSKKAEITILSTEIEPSNKQFFTPYQKVHAVDENNNYLLDPMGFKKVFTVRFTNLNEVILFQSTGIFTGNGISITPFSNWYWFKKRIVPIDEYGVENQNLAIMV